MPETTSMKPVQELIGQRAIEAFADFARADLESPDQLENGKFRHVGDPRLRRALAQVFYGARWVYKLGLVTLARNEERAAHVRAQIVDYASLCEALLSYCIERGIDHGHAIGTAHHWTNPDETVPARRKPIRWGAVATATLLRKQGFWWHARIAREFQVISGPLFDRLDWLRKERNAVHVRQRLALGATAYLNESRKAYAILLSTLHATRIWCSNH